MIFYMVAGALLRVLKSLDRVALTGATLPQECGPAGEQATCVGEADWGVLELLGALRVNC